MKNKRRAFGQNYLIHRGTIQKILDLTQEEIRKGEVRAVVEVGIGEGALTLPLEELCESHALPLFLIEKDRDLIAHWKDRFPQQLFEEDATRVNLEALNVPPHSVLVSNLPYSSATRILNHLSAQSQLRSMILMFQKEVGEKLLAPEGSSLRGSLTLWIQNTWLVEKKIFVPAHCFKPAPKVDSLVLRFQRRSTPLIAASQNASALWEGTLRAAFRQKRKMLRSNFQSDAYLKNALVTSEVDGTKRAEHLTWPEWNRLFEAVVDCRNQS